jgi:hypothetical protein
LKYFCFKVEKVPIESDEIVSGNTIPLQESTLYLAIESSLWNGRRQIKVENSEWQLYKSTCLVQLIVNLTAFANFNHLSWNNIYLTKKT